MYTCHPNSPAAEIRGKLGHWIYVRNQYGMCKRPWKEHRTMSSQAQLDVQQQFKGIGLRWNAILTEAQRTGWRALAETVPHLDQLKQSAPLSGQNLYLSLCGACKWYSGIELDDPPGNLIGPPPMKIITLVADSSPQSLLITCDRIPAANEYWIFTASRPLNVGRATPGQAWCWAGWADETTTYPYEMIDDYTYYNGALIATKKLFMRVSGLYTDNGVITQGDQTSVIIA